MPHPILREIHRFWFGVLRYRDSFRLEQTDMWFSRSDETDRQVRERFGAFIPEAAAMDWDVAKLARPDAIALVVLFDQFPRNIFRESQEAFAYDAKALDITKELLAIKGLDSLFLLERAAVGLPFEHSEDISDQDFGVALIASLAVSAPEEYRDFFRGQLDYATKHRDIIRRFGRFPHRNEVLGRRSTPEETAFLEKGRGF